MKKNARSAAFEALERCRKDSAWSSAVLDNAIRAYEFSPRDAALASRLCLGILQNESYLDYYIGLFSRGKLDPKVRQVLRIGAYQLLFLDKVPAHAAVSESVELCREAGFDRASSLVNAVLRRLSESREDLPPLPGPGSPSYLALRWSHPLWLAEKLVRERGYAFTEAFFRANNDTPPLCIQVNRLRIDPEQYMRSLQRASVSFRFFPDLPGCLELEGGRVPELPGYEEGLFYVQDRAARSAVQAAGVRPGMTILDACSAPGGKSFAAALDAEGNCKIVSCDLHEKKLRLVLSGAERLGIDSCIETLPADARAFRPDWDSSFDLVFADVPCSGMGVIRKHPEIRRKSEADIASLPRIQADILENLSRYVKPGGVLLYSTCTVLPEENVAQISSFLRLHPEYSWEDFSIGGASSQQGCRDFWPQTDGTDGFFAAKLRRKTV